MFYVQDSRNFVGNSPLWWAKGRSGYTCDIDKAELFTEQEAMKLFEDRSTDIPWKKEDVENAVKRLVDSQYLQKNDEDGFYSKLEKLKEQKQLEAQQKQEEYRLKHYQDNELAPIAEAIYWQGIKGFEAFSLVFNEVKKHSDWYEHYYPTAYNKSEKEIFDDLAKFGFIFQCSECGEYFSIYQRDENYTSLCDCCGEEKWEKENQ